MHLKEATRKAKISEVAVTSIQITECQILEHFSIIPRCILKSATDTFQVEARKAVAAL